MPTKTQNLYDLIIAIRRLTPMSNPSYRLKELSIELPVSDGHDSGSPGNIREPLLPKGGYSGPGVRMTDNLRFVPTLYNNAHTTSKQILGIRLIPRSGQSDATIKLLNDGRTTEASVRLAQCPVMPIVDTSTRVTIAQVDNNGKATGRTPRVERGICNIVLKETYVDDQGQEQTVITGVDGPPQGGRQLWVLKADQGDVDVDGKEV